MRKTNERIAYVNTFGLDTDRSLFKKKSGFIGSHFSSGKFVKVRESENTKISICVFCSWAKNFSMQFNYFAYSVHICIVARNFQLF